MTPQQKKLDRLARAIVRQFAASCLNKNARDVQIAMPQVSKTWSLPDFDTPFVFLDPETKNLWGILGYPYDLEIYALPWQSVELHPSLGAITAWVAQFPPESFMTLEEVYIRDGHLVAYLTWNTPVLGAFFGLGFHFDVQTFTCLGAHF